MSMQHSKEQSMLRPCTHSLKAGWSQQTGRQPAGHSGHIELVALHICGLLLSEPSCRRGFCPNLNPSRRVKLPAAALALSFPLRYCLRPACTAAVLRPNLLGDRSLHTVSRLHFVRKLGTCHHFRGHGSWLAKVSGAGVPLLNCCSSMAPAWQILCAALSQTAPSRTATI